MKAFLGLPRVSSRRFASYSATVAIGCTLALGAAIGAERSVWEHADHNGEFARRCLMHCRDYVRGWLAHADPATGLIPRNLNRNRDFWNGRDAAADNYAFMVLTC